MNKTYFTKELNKTILLKQKIKPFNKYQRKANKLCLAFLSAPIS